MKPSPGSIPIYVYIHLNYILNRKLIFFLQIVLEHLGLTLLYGELDYQFYQSLGNTDIQETFKRVFFIETYSWWHILYFIKKVGWKFILFSTRIKKINKVSCTSFNNSIVVSRTKKKCIESIAFHSTKFTDLYRMLILVDIVNKVLWVFSSH